MFFIFGLSVFISGLCLFNLFIPSFEKEKEASQRAIRFTRSQAEWEKRKKPKIIRVLGDKVIPKLTKLNVFNLERLLGSEMKTNIEVMGKYNSMEDMIATKLVFALAYSAPFLSICVVLEGFYWIIPAAFIFFFVKGISDVKQSYKKMQREIITDLPKFIEKMMMALETGKSFILVFRELERTSGPRMKKLLNHLNSDLQDMDPAKAIEQFARSTTIPVMLQFSAAIKIGINSGYEESKEYFDDLQLELEELRKTSLEQITLSRPERIKYLQMLLIFVGILAVFICFIHLFSTSDLL